MTSEENDLRRGCRHVLMTLRVLVQTACAGEERRNPLLLGNRKVGLAKVQESVRSGHAD